MKKRFLVMNSEDNCATSLEDMPKGEKLEVKEGKIIIFNQPIPFGHKFALTDINKGELLKKYGQIIGVVTEDIKMGDWVHIHNIKSHYLESVANE